MGLFKTYSEKEVKRIMPLVAKINELEGEISKLSDTDLKAKTEEFKNRYKDGESLDEIGDFKYDTNRNIEALYVHILNTEPFLDVDEVIEEMNQILAMNVEGKKMSSLFILMQN